MSGGLARSAAAAAVLVIFAASAQAQNDELLSPVDLEKLRLRVLDETNSTALPPDARKALGLPDGRIEFKQIAAGLGTTQYFFMVRSDGEEDDICVSIRTEKDGTRLYLTNSQLRFRGAAHQRPRDRIRAIPPGDHDAAAEFQELLRVWAQIAQSL